MKKVFFVSAIMCMAMAAFVACNKNDGNNPEGGNGGNGGGSGMCTCYALGQNLGDFESGPMTCAQLAQATMDAMGGTYTVTCNPK